MSIQNDIKMVKEELNSEEKFFEKAVITEKFIKKYKKLLIGSVVALVVFVSANIGYTINEQHRIDGANELLAELQIDAKNQAALSRLESVSPSLHDAWLYSQAVVEGDLDVLHTLETSKLSLISDLSSYMMAQNSQDVTKLENYATTQDAIYKDLAKVQGAILLMNINKIDAAHEKLSMISINSPLSKVATVLMHYGVK